MPPLVSANTVIDVEILQKESAPIRINSKIVRDESWYERQRLRDNQARARKAARRRRARYEHLSTTLSLIALTIPSDDRRWTQELDRVSRIFRSFDQDARETESYRRLREDTQALAEEYSNAYPLNVLTSLIDPGITHTTARKPFIELRGHDSCLQCRANSSSCTMQLGTRQRYCRSCIGLKTDCSLNHIDFVGVHLLTDIFRAIPNAGSTIPELTRSLLQAFTASPRFIVRGRWVKLTVQYPCQNCDLRVGIVCWPSGTGGGRSTRCSHCIEHKLRCRSKQKADIWEHAQNKVDLDMPPYAGPMLGVVRKLNGY
jgi:hypothetical protein